MLEKLKHGVIRALLTLARPQIERWLETRALYVSKQRREELAKQFGVPPELVDTLYQTVRAKALTELRKIWSE